MPPLTEQALGEHIRLMDEEGDQGSIYRMAVGLDNLARMSSPSPSLRLQHQQQTGSSRRMEKGKLVGVLKYLKSQHTLTQESLPVLLLADDEACEQSRPLGSVADNREDMRTSILAGPAQQRSCRGSTRRRSRRGLRGASSQQQVESGGAEEPLQNSQQESLGASAAGLHLATIHALPSVSLAPGSAVATAAATAAGQHSQPGRLGIFSKGKSVASNMHDVDFTSSAGVLRRTRSTKSQQRAPQPQGDDQRKPASAPASRNSSHIAADSVGYSATTEPQIDLNTNGATDATDILGPRLTHQEQPFIDYSNMYDSLSDGTLDRTDDYHYRSPYTSSPPVPQSCPQPHLVYSDNSHSVRRLPNNDGLRMQPSSSSSQPAYLASSNTHLLNSIEECLNEDGFAIAGCPSRMDVDEREDGGPSAVVSGAVDAANLSFIFDESDGHDDYPRDLIGNISNTALSAFASHIFSSNPDMASARHVGERTVSDFNNSVYHRHRPLHLPSADRHVSFGDLRDDSYDILPEYQPQTELPPPYPQSTNNSSSYISNRSRQFRRQSSLHETSLFNRSRGAISLSVRSEEGSAHRNARRYDIHNALYSSNSSVARRPNNASDEMNTRFRYYPRQLN